MKLPRVLYVVTVRLAYEGITMSALNFIRNMDRTKVHVDVASPGPVDEGIRQELESLGCAVHIIDGRLKSPAGYMLKLMQLVRRGGYDIVQAHGNSCTLAIDLMAAYLGGAKVRIAHSHNSFCKFMKAHKLLRIPFDMLYTHSFACGKEAGEWLFPGKRFTVVRNATDSRKYLFDPGVRAEYRSRLGLGNELVLGSVAGMNDQKNHMFMLAVLADLKRVRSDVKLVLVGDGPLRGDIEERVSRLGLEGDVVFTGVRRDVPQLLQAFDVMLLPSLYEGFPCVLVEWQCAGLRALVSDTVTGDADLTGLVRYLPIDKGTAPWVDVLKDIRPDDDRAMTSANAVMQVRDKGYDIVRTAKDMQKFYIDAVNHGK